MSQAGALAADEKPEAAPARRGPRNLVLIAGGGIGGLAAAIALARRGIPSHVLERRDAFAEDGAGIQIGPNGTRILSELGIGEALKPHTASPEALRVMDGVHASEIARLPLGRWIAERHGSPFWTAHRADLHAALVARARSEPLIRLSFSSGVREVENGPAGVTVRLANGTALAGAALIAADGIRSSIRDMLNGPVGLVPAGKSAARAVLSAEAMPDGFRRPVTTIWLRPKAHIVHYPVRAGHEFAIIAVFEDAEATESWSTPVLPAWVMEQAAAFPPPLKALLAAPRAWRKWSLYRSPSIPRWTSGRVALLGDAAHPVLPFLAQGAVLALEDAMVLAASLAAQPAAPAAALTRYEEARRSRARRVARASARNGTRYHHDGLKALARNMVLSTLPPERIMAGYDWLYGWRAPAA